jgi:hypothetical protein
VEAQKVLDSVSRKYDELDLRAQADELGLHFAPLEFELDWCEDTSKRTDVLRRSIESQYERTAYGYGRL